MHTHCVRKLFGHALMYDCVEMKRSLQHRDLSFEKKNDTHTRSLSHSLSLSLSLSLYLGGQSNSIAPPTAAHGRVFSAQDTHTLSLEHTLWDTTRHRVICCTLSFRVCVCVCCSERECAYVSCFAFRQSKTRTNILFHSECVRTCLHSVIQSVFVRVLLRERVCACLALHSDKAQSRLALCHSECVCGCLHSVI